MLRVILRICDLDIQRKTGFFPIKLILETFIASKVHFFLVFINQNRRNRKAVLTFVTFFVYLQVPVGGGAGGPDTAGQSEERGGQHAAAALPGLTSAWSRAPAVSLLGHAVASCRTPGSSKRAETRTRRTFS